MIFKDDALIKSYPNLKKLKFLRVTNFMYRPEYINYTFLKEIKQDDLPELKKIFVRVWVPKSEYPKLYVRYLESLK